MSLFAAQANHLRVREGGHARVTNIELFFDLVFVFAVTQLSHGLLAHFTPLGALQTAVLMLAVWWAWIDTAWITNWLDPERPLVRLFLVVLMLFGLVLAAAIPKAFEERALGFALAYLAMHATRDLFMMWALRRHNEANFYNFLRIGLWHAAGAPLWIAGCFVDPQSRISLWAIAVAIETIGPLTGFRVPGLGRSTTGDWAVEGAHIAERCALFVIIALGESILITGATFATQPWTSENAAAFVVAFAGSVAMWGVYFNVGAERGSHHIAHSADPGRLARSGYTYLHIPIVAGIILCAVSDELLLHHATGHSGTKETIAIVGGPGLYLLGNALFKRLTAPNFPFSHIVGLVLLAVLPLFAHSLTPLALAAGATAVLIIVVTWEWRSIGPGRSAAH